VAGQTAATSSGDAQLPAARARRHLESDSALTESRRGGYYLAWEIAEDDLLELELDLVAGVIYA
jgi:hypothetical protein